MRTANTPATDQWLNALSWATILAFMAAIAAHANWMTLGSVFERSLAPGG